MKPQKKNRQRLYLPKRNNRWKWMAGATAATAAGVTTSQANTVTINLTGNFISAREGDHLNPDLTGDGHPDLTIANAYFSRRVRTSYGTTVGGFTRSHVGVTLNGILARGY